MMISLRQPAEPGTRFAGDAFTSQIGKTVPVNTPGGRRMGKVVDAQVTPDGEAVDLVLDVEGFEAPTGAIGTG